MCDSEHCVALSLMPQRKKSDQDGRQWWVSAWIPALDGYDLILSPELISVPNRREVVLKKPLPGDDAVVTAVQLLTELRIRSAFARAGETLRSEILRCGPRAWMRLRRR